MNDIILSHKRWQQIFDVQLIIALIITVLELITKKQRNFGNIFQLVFLILIVGLNFYVQFNRHNSSKLNFEITRWLNLLVFSSYFTIIWLVVGNYLIFNFRQFEILWVLLLWAAYLVLLLPLAILYTGKLWLPMLYHFLMDYLANLQSGWNSAGWTFSGYASDYIQEILMVGVPLVFTIWMMYGKRRAVIEENVDRLLNLKDSKFINKKVSRN